MIDRFDSVWLCDFEFISKPGEKPLPVCMVAYELRSGKRRRLWRDQLTHCFLEEGPNTLFVAYYASAELACFLSLGWPRPSCVLDLFVEFRNLTNGRELVAGRGLLGALAYFGLDGIGAIEKEEMRSLILRGDPWTREEQIAILDYCESDVMALKRLFFAMSPYIDLPRALHRGRYMWASAAMEANGVPIDVKQLGRLRKNWTKIQDNLVSRINSDYQVFEGRSFRLKLFEQYLERKGLLWRRLESGRLDLSDQTFREMSKIVPEIAPLRELRHALSEMRLNDLAVGSDGRNRCLLSAFGARSGRNTPSNKEFIFGPAVWLRNLIKPPTGHGLVYIDWIQQEFGIAAALSSDPAMLEAYQSGDCYLAFAKQARAIPEDATKRSHPVERELFNQCILGTNYGMEEASLAVRINQPVIVARRLLERHRETYSRFWKWIENAVNHAILHGWQQTVFGWINWVTAPFNPRSLRNFHMQANGAEMLRLACCLAIERGIKICAPVHDAVLIESPLDRLKNDVAIMRECMEKASRVVLDGFALRTEFKTIRYPYHYQDPRGERMWREVSSLCRIQIQTRFSTTSVLPRSWRRNSPVNRMVASRRKGPQVRDSASTNSRWKWRKTF